MHALTVFSIVLLALVPAFLAYQSDDPDANWVPSRSGYVDWKVEDKIEYFKQMVITTALKYQRGAPVQVNVSAPGYIDQDLLKQACWKDSFGRGVGKPIHACPEGQDKDAGLCYPPCKPGYDGVGPVCWEQCKPGYTDTGAFCGKSGKIISANNDACPWYDICGLTFEKGCSFCPKNDPPYKNDGCTCRIDPHTYAKDSYGRGVGKPMGCSSNEDYDAGLCYSKCPSGYYGVGPVCWQHCPVELSYDYGAVCCESKDACNEFIKECSKAAISFVASLVEAGFMPWKIEEIIKEALETAGAFTLMSCTRFNY